jgi:Zn-dependent peptidase ImmA (M78 family)/DNA-binding XRE family transcriptional regulator
MGHKGDNRQLSMFGGASGEFRERVRRLRLVRRWDQTTLATRSGLSTAAISNIELGRVAPTDDQIAAIAAALRYSPDFLTAERRLVPTTRPWLRAYADASKREADARIAATTTAAEYIRSLGLKPLPDLIPAFGGSLSDEEAIDDAAGELRQLAEIEPNAVVTNAVRAAERVGCVVLPLESELGRHFGMSVRADQIPMMCVAKTGVPGDRERWTVAHELGHLTLHSTVGPPRDAHAARRMEDQAHRFAAAFLCPADPLIETLGDAGGAVTLRSLAEMKAVWGVAIKSLARRFRELGIIDSDHERSLYKQISSRQWNKQEPVYVPTESAQWFRRSVARKAQLDDVPAACNALALAVGGNAGDLLSFVDWTAGPEAQVFDIVEHQERRRR